ncbi:hypothetical protein [Arthrobacter sp. H16F315]|uniref:hypothetical protein n=1 Tax=Arthrobacter sp. H16F315 TaxID=2955314 RepID=UPI0020974F36|nr:hypothetical protein [Arthrobacter sp. H16F315]MDD1475664.1 hypothetical protein [Arthrobacter sp. H16F315]
MDIQAPDSSLVAWTALLDVLEMAVQSAERTLHDPLGPLASPQDVVAAGPAQRWTPPAVPGPLPAEARRRALALAAAQERVAHRLEAARHDIARQLGALASVPGIGSRPGAVYLDVHG